MEEKSKERRKKYQKENNRQSALNNSFNSNAAQNYEKVVCLFSTLFLLVLGIDLFNLSLIHI